jgi:hypothetical protein
MRRPRYLRPPARPRTLLLVALGFLPLLGLCSALRAWGRPPGAPTARAPSYHGYHDSVDCNYVSGWVMDANATSTRLKVSVYDGAAGPLVAEGTADLFRQDLYNLGIGDGRYGFRIPTPAALKNGLSHNVTVRVTGTTFNLGNTPRTFNSAASCAGPSGPVTMTILNRSDEPRHANFRIQSAGFSVSYTSNKYLVYGTSGYDQWRWNATYTGWDGMFNLTFPFFSERDDCSYARDPRLWPLKCSTDAIGHFSKEINCPPGGGVACQDNDRWNAWPGTYNLTTFASPEVWPNRPHEEFGLRGFRSIIDAGIINSVQIQPASGSCQSYGDTVWVDDTVPRTAAKHGTNETWKWVYASPSPTPFPIPQPGTTPVPLPSPVGVADPEFPPPPFPSWLSHQSARLAGVHQHYFDNSPYKLNIGAGDKLFAYIYINRDSPPTEVMLQWLENGSWEHRAYWSNSSTSRIPWGAEGTISKRRVGSLDSLLAGGGWVRLEVAAADVGLVGKSLDGMAFTLYNGQATWDRAGKATPLPAGRTCPPKTWSGATPAKSFHAYNPDDFATGAANGKVVQVKYADGTTRWFMAFNKQIKYTTTTYSTPAAFNASNFGGSAADHWQVMWATSPDGARWTVHPQMLFRSSGETLREHLGALMIDLVVDDGYFYLLFQDLVKPRLYLMRAPIDAVNSPAGPGYIQNSAQGWRLATTLQANGEYTWSPFTLGARLSFASLGAHPVMPARIGTQGGFVKQAAITRIFSATSPGTSAYFGVTNDSAGPLQLWKTSSLSRPFQYESDVVMEDPTIRPGAFGWELGFTHYADNVPASPRNLGSGFDWWMTEDIREQSPTGASIDGWIVVGRHTARLSNF